MHFEWDGEPYAYSAPICAFDDIHMAQANSAFMALAASKAATDQTRRSCARSITSTAYFLFNLRVLTTVDPMSRKMPFSALHPRF